MPFGPLERRLQTLRFRLTFWNTAAIILVVLATLFGIREGLRWTLLRELDTLLSEDMQEVLLTLERYYPDSEQVAFPFTACAAACSRSSTLPSCWRLEG